MIKLKNSVFYIILSTIVSLFAGTECFGQTHTDSLLLLLRKADDKSKVEILNKISWDLRNSKPEEAIKYSKQAIELAEKTQNYPELANAFGYTGITYKKLGNYSEAFDYYFKGLDVAQKHKLPEKEGYALINIGNLYIYQEHYADALENLNKALIIATETNNDKMTAYCDLYIGRCYFNKKDFTKANKYFTEALLIRISIKDIRGAADCYKELGNVFLAQDKFQEAIKNFSKCLNNTDKKSDQDLYSEVLNNTAVANFKLNQFKVAENLAEQSLKSAQFGNTKLRIRNACKTLSSVEASMGNSAKAYKYLTLVSVYNDSLFNEQLSEKISSLEKIAAQQKKQSEIDLLKKDQQIQKLEIERRKFYNYVLGISSFILILMILFVIKNLNYRKKQNQYLKVQKDEIEIKNKELSEKQDVILTQKKDLENSLRIQEDLNQKLSAQNITLDTARVDLENFSKELLEKNEELTITEEELRQTNEELLTLNENIEFQKQTITKVHKNISDSINYAKSIQISLLPNKELMDTVLHEYMLFYKPKDKVSGDFYYINKVNKNVIFAVADCTGHGVPGAFLSMLGITYLHEILTTYITEKPNRILEILRQRFKSIFKSFGSENTNGMDIALCIIDTQTNILHYSGAYNPLILIRNNEISEFAATRNPIGNYPSEKDFINNEIGLENNDLMYIFSDGFQDQLGGKFSRKYTKNRFKEFLLKISKLPLLEQQEMFSAEFEKWKQSEQQLDDITILATKWIET